MTSRILVALRIAAPPSRVFTAFTDEIGAWWRPHGLFELNGRLDGRLGIEPGVGGRVTESYPDGESFDVGRIRIWEPPERLTFTWRAASFPPDRETEVAVRFEAVADGTRVVVEHLGWDGLPQGHAARHGFPLLPFQQRLAGWWQALLGDLSDRAQRPPERPGVVRRGDPAEPGGGRAPVQQQPDVPQDATPGSVPVRRAPAAPGGTGSRPPSGIG